MAGSDAVLAAIAVVLTGTAAWAISAARRRPYLPGSLAEYDPRSPDPLRSALRCGLAGVQLPVWPGSNGELYVGRAEPDRPDPAGVDTLRRGVLEPLLRRIAATGGQVYEDREESFDLIIELPGDLTDAGPALRAYDLLDGCLRDHAAILTSWTAENVTPGPVTVTITGRLSARQLLAERHQRHAGADGTLDDLGSTVAPPWLTPLLSEQWSWRFGWDGLGPMPPEERHLLHYLVREAHAEGRRVRFLGLPERPARARTAFWCELSAAGVDLIGSRRVRALARHLRRRAVRASAPRWSATVPAPASARLPAPAFDGEPARPGSDGEPAGLAPAFDGEPTAEEASAAEVSSASAGVPVSGA
jgi:hypothetical protein